MRHFHALTPGDHFSPRTGSAVATVVHGLAQHTHPRPAVLVARGTYEPRYDSADSIEYELGPSFHGTSRTDRLKDAVLGAVGHGRPLMRRQLAPVVSGQGSWESGVVIAHNAPQLVPLVSQRHVAVLYAHNQLFRTYTPFEASRVLDRVHRIIVVSESAATAISQRLAPRIRQRIRIVNNGVDGEHFQKMPRTASNGPVRVTFLGRIIPDKGANVLLQSLRAFSTTEIRVNIVGSAGFDPTAPLTRYEESLRRIAREISPIVTFTPSLDRDGVVGILRSTDVLVVPSVWPEPFGLTALEGMAAGCAVVASRIGGLPEAVGQAGILVPPNNPVALTETLVELTRDRSLISRYSALGQRRAIDRDWRSVAGEFAAALL